MVVLVAVHVEVPGNRPGPRGIHQLTRVPSVGEKILLRGLGPYVVTDVMHFCLEQMRGGEPQATIGVKPL